MEVFFERNLREINVFFLCVFDLFMCRGVGTRRRKDKRKGNHQAKETRKGGILNPNVL
jgi:hypothetical protein